MTFIGPQMPERGVYPGEASGEARAPCSAQRPQLTSTSTAPITTLKVTTASVYRNLGAACSYSVRYIEARLEEQGVLRLVVNVQSLYDANISFGIHITCMYGLICLDGALERVCLDFHGYGL